MKEKFTREEAVSLLKKYNKDMTIGEVISDNEKAKAVLMGFGMHCFSCPMSQMETLEEAAAVHGVDVKFMIEKLEELDNAPKKKEKKTCDCCKKETK